MAFHFPLLRLPYFWDEAGYYVPAARDILLSGSLIPHSTLTNAHPPLMLCYLALAWKVFGYAPLVARCAMLLVSAFCLAGVYRLAARVANEPAAVGSVIATALFPVYFAQSSMVHPDMAAAALIVWGLDFYIAGRRANAIVFLALACLAKETAVLVPVVLCAWELGARYVFRLSSPGDDGRESREEGSTARNVAKAATLLLPLLPLAVWFLYHYARTGHVFGNPEFVRYNVDSTLHPLRFVAALAIRVWHIFGYMNMALLTAAMLLAMTLEPRMELGTRTRSRIAVPTQLLFGVLVLAHVVALSVIGGAVLARYLLPVYPLAILVAVATMRRRLPWWPAFLAVVCAGFVVALITEPPYRFAPEDNLAYSDYVRLHQSAERFTAQHFPAARVLTAWPASDELMRPWLGYVDKPVKILRIENFSVEQLMAATDARNQFTVALLFSTKEEPQTLLTFAWWERWQSRFFDYHRDVPPAEAAQLLGGQIVFQQRRGAQWVAVVAMQTIENAGKF